MKKLLLFLAAAVMSMTVSFAQVDAKAAAKAQKEAAKEIKKAQKEARKTLKEAQGILNEEGGNVNQAEALINKAMANEYTKDDPEVWNTAGQIQKKLYDKENEKMYLQQKYDTTLFFNSLSKMFTYFLKCDELEQIPDAKGKLKVKYRQPNSELLVGIRQNLVSGGVTFFNKDQNKQAFDLFAQYIEVADAPMLAPFNISKTDSLLPVVAYYATLAGMKLEDYPKAVKYVDMAIENPEYGQSAIQYKAMAYKSMNDTVNWLETLKKGVELYPNEEFFYSNLIAYYNDTDQNDKLMLFADEMIAKNPSPIFRFVKGFLYQNMKKYNEAIEEYKVAIEGDPNYTGAYRNLAICYCQLAQDYSDGMTNLDVKSKKYKQEQEHVKSFYKLALPLYEKLRSMNSDDPEVRSAWVNGLYTCYYMLNMGPEFEEIEKLVEQQQK